MKASVAASILLLLSPVVSSLAVPRGDEPAALDGDHSGDPAVLDDLPYVSSDLEKRRGGGGGGGKSGGGSSGSSSSSGGSSGSSGSSRYGGSSSGSSGSSGSSKSSSLGSRSKGSSGSSSSSSSSKGSSSKSSSSDTGGTTKSGSGTAKTYGNYYSGGATTPFTSGGRTASGIAPYVLVGGALGFASAAAWHHSSAYAYPYPVAYYYSQPMTTGTNHGTAGNYSMNVVCYCDEYSVCGCDNNSNSTYLAEVIGNPPQNSSIVTIVQNGTNETAYINGTLANGTTAADANASRASSVAALQGLLPVAMLVSAMMYVV